RNLKNIWDSSARKRRPPFPRSSPWPKGPVWLFPQQVVQEFPGGGGVPIGGTDLGYGNFPVAAQDQGFGYTIPLHALGRGGFRKIHGKPIALFFKECRHS